MRWTSAELGPVSPARFIPIAEESGLILALGDWALRTACAQGAAWMRDGLPALTISVNLSPRELRDPHLVDRIAAVLRDTGLPPRCRELELTEGVMMDDVEANIAALTAVRALGVSLAIDDFGTGYSSLAYLARLPIRTLKIDRAFVAEIGDEGHARALVSAMVNLAHSLALTVVAEGVETAQQQAVLAALGCDQLQGYHVGRPLPAAEIESVLRPRERPPLPVPLLCDGSRFARDAPVDALAA